MERYLKLLLLLLLPVFGIGQGKYALLDKKLKLPILYTDSVTVEQIKKGFFPVENKNIDTLISNLQYLADMVSKRQRAKMQRFELRQASTVFEIERVPFAYGDRYNSRAVTQVGELSAFINILNSNLSNRENMAKVDRLLRYLESNKSFYTKPYEITPKIYNIVVITE